MKLLFGELGDPRQVLAVALRAFGGLFGGGARRLRGATANYMLQMGNRSLVFVTATLGFIGMVLVFQTCLQVNRITGDLTLVGAELMKILTHEFGPTLTALMLATRVGAGIAAEIGSMVATEQVDALKMSGIDPVDYLVVPRLRASLMVTPALACYGVAVAIVVGAATANISFGVNPHVFFDLSRVRWSDLVTGGAKCIAYGAAIPIVSGAAGLASRGGSVGVGAATTRAVIASSFAVIVLDLIISAIAVSLGQGEA